MPDPNDYDLEYRPKTYFVFADAKQQVAARVKGTARRAIARRLGASEEIGDDIRVDDFNTKSSLTDDERAAWGAVHPSCMGGEYLPDLDDTEVEIARVDLASTTSDVISVRAARRDGKIHYTVVDEYPDQHDYRCTPAVSEQPLTMAELIELIDSTVGDCYVGIVLGLLQFNYECSEDLESYRDFVSVSSPFYPELGDWYDQAIEEWYLAAGGELEPPEDEEE